MNCEGNHVGDEEEESSEVGDDGPATPEAEGSVGVILEFERYVVCVF